MWAEEARRGPECNPNGEARFILTCVLAIANHDRFPGRAAEKEVIRHHNDDTKRPRTHRCVMDGRISGRISKVNPKDHPTQQ